MKRKGPRRDGDKERFWRATIARQRRSGQTIRRFCSELGVSEPSFYAWRGELKRRRAERAEKVRASGAGRPAFLPVRLAVAGAASWSAGVIEAVLPSGAVLRLPADIEPARVAAMVLAWERGRC
jgi:hypothetical protein